ncbi:MAG: CD1375 family protein [Bacillota bacterium]|nr:CD1375 family protein [Bacillota bacterium]
MKGLFLLLAKILCRKEEKTMAVIYATLIVKGLKNIDDVPQILRVRVQEILAALELN